MEKIRSNAKKKIKRIFDNAKNCKVYTLYNSFSGEPIDFQELRKQMDERHYSSLYVSKEGKYRIRLHSNHWYEFDSI